MTLKGTENQLEKLATEVEQLKKKVERLEAAVVEGALRPDYQRRTMQQAPTAGEEMPEKEGAQEELWSWLGKASLLPRIATISFALLIALMLRTLTDNNVIAYPVGSSIGMGYAALLIGFGWWLYTRRSRLAPVFPVCGGILLFLIVLEAHARFGALSSATGYVILLTGLVALVLLSGRYQFPFLATLGLVGAGITGFAIDFPDPSFPLLAIFLLIANGVAYLDANRQYRKETARWGLFLLTTTLWINWMIKLQMALQGGNALTAQLGASWFAPLLVLYLGVFTAMTLHRFFYLGRLTSLDIGLPTISGVLFYLAGRGVAVPWLGGQTTWVGMAGLGWLGLLFLMAIVGVYKSQVREKAACVYTFAGSTLLLLAVPDITSSLLLALPVWSVGALFLIKLSGHCEIGGIRLASYLLQVVACVAGIVAGIFSIHSPHLLLALVITSWLAVLSGLHYRISRRMPITCSAGFFAKIDPRDQTALFLLLVTVVNGFCALQLGAALALAGTSVNFGITMTGLRSVLLNGGAFLLMIAGLRGGNREILAVALAVFIGGAVKVFGYDLFQIRGIPLLMSVFSFGAAAALGSVVLSRWQQNIRQPG
jgi:hypothetical protein